jgi:hypothetical protein
LSNCVALLNVWCNFYFYYFYFYLLFI